jgi:hypothetical protein
MHVHICRTENLQQLSKLYDSTRVTENKIYFKASQSPKKFPKALLCLPTDDNHIKHFKPMLLTVSCHLLVQNMYGFQT